MLRCGLIQSDGFSPPGKEDEVLDAIRAEKKAMKRKEKNEKSFHDSSPRACTLKAKLCGDEVRTVHAFRFY